MILLHVQRMTHARKLPIVTKPQESAQLATCKTMIAKAIGHVSQIQSAWKTNAPRNRKILIAVVICHYTVRTIDNVLRSNARVMIHVADLPIAIHPTAYVLLAPLKQITASPTTPVNHLKSAYKMFARLLIKTLLATIFHFIATHINSVPHLPVMTAMYVQRLLIVMNLQMCANLVT